MSFAASLLPPTLVAPKRRPAANTPNPALPAAHGYLVDTLEPLPSLIAGLKINTSTDLSTAQKSRTAAKMASSRQRRFVDPTPELHNEPTKAEGEGGRRGCTTDFRRPPLPLNDTSFFLEPSASKSHEYKDVRCVLARERSGKRSAKGAKGSTHKLQHLRHSIQRVARPDLALNGDLQTESTPSSSNQDLKETYTARGDQTTVTEPLKMRHEALEAWSRRR
ncbi:hypothetical protein NMY22_g17340 [Coprinellus aureogranulatus]|nr:hypothetical protein NMY22_g17340 [Coprinellus aureogranulatus]